MKSINENIIIAKNDTGKFAYRSFIKFCEATGIDRKKFRTIPGEVSTPFGSFEIEKLPMNVSMECHKLREFLCGKFRITSFGKIHCLVKGKKTHYRVQTDKLGTSITSCTSGGKEITLDELTKELIITKIKK